MVRDDQPDAREGQAGRCGVAERLAVPLKPGNAGEGRGLSSRQTQDVLRDLGIGQDTAHGTFDRPSSADEFSLGESGGNCQEQLRRAVSREMKAGSLAMNNKTPPDDGAIDSEQRERATLRRLLATPPDHKTNVKPGASPKKRGRPLKDPSYEWKA